jgi:hypothetical protein
VVVFDASTMLLLSGVQVSTGICAACGAGTAGAAATHNAGCAKAQFSEWRSHLREQIC